MTLDEILKIAVNKGASDVHIVTGKSPILRIDGELFEIDKVPTLDPSDAENIILKILSSGQKEKFTKNKDLDLSYEIDDGNRFRVNCHIERGHYGLAARIIPQKIPTMEEITMPEEVYDLTRMHQGLIIVTGPTGCGKSTSLAAMIQLINSERAVNIITLEDPIEFIHKPDKSIIRQRELGNDMNSFAEGLKHILRQDPNVIMVGEMRDLETIGATITLAETGHLVLATLHTPNAAQTVDRIIDVFPPYQQDQIRMQLSMALSGVISQQLMPGKKGGRVAAREIMINTPAISNLIRENKIAQIRSVIQTSAKEGMITMDRALKKLLDDGLITKEEAELRVLSTNTIK